MRRVCFIGDSHLAAVKQGWQAVAPEFPDLTPVFFAVGGTRLGGLSVAGNALVTADVQLARVLQLRAGQSEIDGSSYEFYVIYGLELSSAIALGAWRDWHKDDGDDAAALQRTMARKVRRTLAIETLDKLRQITAAPVLLSPAPLRDSVASRTIEKIEDPKTIAAAFVASCRRVARRHGARFSEWPAETLTQDGLAIRSEFFKQPVRLFPVADVENDSHADATYGALVAKHLMREHFLQKTD